MQEINQTQYETQMEIKQKSNRNLIEIKKITWTSNRNHIEMQEIKNKSNISQLEIKQKSNTNISNQL